MLVERYYQKELNRRIKKHLQIKLLRSQGKLTKLTRTISADLQTLLQDDIGIHRDRILTNLKIKSNLPELIPCHLSVKLRVWMTLKWMWSI
jgi:5-bromo-4-chloroindolyl phosphate hydrolysis protein